MTHYYLKKIIVKIIKKYWNKFCKDELKEFINEMFFEIITN